MLWQFGQLLAMQSFVCNLYTPWVTWINLSQSCGTWGVLNYCDTRKRIDIHIKNLKNWKDLKNVHFKEQQPSLTGKHINLMQIWPSCDHVPSERSSQKQHLKGEECGLGGGWFPIHTTEVPAPGRSTARLQLLASHQHTSTLSEHGWKEDDFTWPRA